MDSTDDRRWKHLAARPLGLVLVAVLPLELPAGARQHIEVDVRYGPE